MRTDCRKGGEILAPIAMTESQSEKTEKDMSAQAERPPRHAPMTNEAEDRGAFLAYYETVRGETEALARPLSPEDQTVQTMPDVSPTKWHLAHTSWFFETFLLKPIMSDYQIFDPKYDYLFNSYYEQVGARHPRPERGLLSRPSVGDISRYRAHIDRAMRRLIRTLPSQRWMEAVKLLILGLNHEQQHQELILTDIKHVLSRNPLAPAAYAPPSNHLSGAGANNGGFAVRGGFAEFEGGATIIGFRPDNALSFAFDNEGPPHETHLRPFRLAERLVTNGEYLAFIEDDGYARPELWLSDGWALLRAEGWDAPFYWRRREDGGFDEFTLHGAAPLNQDAPVAHVSYYEASAYAHWAGKRLPREEEHERVLAQTPIEGHMGARIRGASPEAAHPAPAPRRGLLEQLYGDLWEWTMSPYMPYPRYRPLPGAVGEYNGKFMCNQFVLKGGSCATPDGHIRASYRNFFPPQARWQFSGIRLADDA